jgi:hypothetical protein
VESEGVVVFSLLSLGGGGALKGRGVVPDCTDTSLLFCALVLSRRSLYPPSPLLSLRLVYPPSFVRLTHVLTVILLFSSLLPCPSLFRAFLLSVCAPKAKRDKAGREGRLASVLQN